MIKKFLGLFGLIALLGSCSDIAEDSRLIEVEAVEPVRTIVIEDFTGQNCVNCPDAHKVMEALVEQYGADYVIPVSIHAGSFAMSASMSNPSRGLICLMQPEGNTLQDRYGEINSWPMGVVNGRGGFTNPDAWAPAVRVELLRRPEAEVSVKASLDDFKDVITITTDITPYADLDARLMLWVVESDIIARQRNTEGWITDYRHDNVWRASATAIDGDPVRLTDGKTLTLTHTIERRNTEKEAWNSTNLSIVAIISTPQGFVNAARTALDVPMYYAPE